MKNGIMKVLAPVVFLAFAAFLAGCGGSNSPLVGEYGKVTAPTSTYPLPNMLEITGSRISYGINGEWQYSAEYSVRSSDSDSVSINLLDEGILLDVKLLPTGIEIDTDHLDAANNPIVVMVSNFGGTWTRAE